MDGQNSKPSSGEHPIVDVGRIADGLSRAVDASTLVDVVVETKMGTKYLFPDMPRGELERVLPESGRILETQPTLMMVNASISVLSIPFRVIKNIEVTSSEPGWTGEVLWACPA